MADDSRHRARRVFMELADLSPADRAEALTRECGDDAALRAEVEALLRAAQQARGFMASPTSEFPPMDPGPAAALRGPPTEHEGQVIGRYKLLQLIGEGGFGSVWMAEQREPVKRRVALKIIKLGMDTGQVIARFEAERQALALMEHPNIARVLDAGSTETGRPYFVMEYIRGVPILEYCDTEKLDTRARLGLFTSVCNAIQHAHQKGIIHRDIKPGNVLVTMHDGVPVPKVIDFGIAKATSSELTAKTLFTGHRQLIGTPAYMSPEQAEMSGLDIDTRSDVYSLGVLLYELLTGTTPFATDELLRKGFAEMMRIIREVEPHKPSTRLSSLGESGTRTAQQRRAADARRLGLILNGDLDWIVMKCLEKDRTRRYDTASGLAADIKRHLNDETVTAGAPSTAYKLRKFAKRHRSRVVAAAVVAAALVLGMIGTTTGMIWAIQERDRAEAATSEETRVRKRAETINGFLSGMLSSLNPKQPIGREVSLRTIIDAASESLDKGKLADTPEIEADVRMTLAGIYYLSLNDWYCAEREYTRAAAIFERLLGPSDRKTLSAMHNVGSMVHYQGRYAEAERLARQTFERRVKAFGEEDPDTIGSMEKISWALSAMGRFDEAEPLRVRALEHRQRVQGENHPDAITALSYLGNLYFEQGKLAEAEALYRDRLERAKRVYGVRHPMTFYIMVNELARCLGANGKTEEAAELCKEALVFQREAFGERHRVVAETLSAIGSAYTRAGRYEEAERALTEALDIRREVVPGEDPVAWSLFDLGTLRASQNRLEEAEVFMRDGLEIRRKLAVSRGGSGDPWSLRALAGVLGAQGRQREADELVREAIAIESKPAAAK